MSLKGVLICIFLGLGMLVEKIQTAEKIEIEGNMVKIVYVIFLDIFLLSLLFNIFRLLTFIYKRLDKCHNKDKACNKFGNQGDKDIFCSIPWSVLNCPRICDDACTFKAAILGPRVKPINVVDECQVTNLNDNGSEYKGNCFKNKATYS